MSQLSCQKCSGIILPKCNLLTRKCQRVLMIFPKFHPKKLLSFFIQKRTTAELSKINEVLHQSDPVFSEMVQYYFHKARMVIEDKLVESMRKDYPFLSQTERATKVKSFMKYLEKPECVLEYKTPFLKDNGESEVLTCYKIQHKGYHLPFIGGLRYSRTVTCDQMIALANLITFKCACAGISHGGSMSGISINPSKYTTHELERITRSFTHKMASAGVIGPSIDVISPDVGTGEREMSWIGDSYRKAFGNMRNVGSDVVTGRTKDQGGMLYNMNPTACSIFHCLQTILNKRDLMESLQSNTGLKGKTFVVQGYGKVGANVSMLLVEAGAKCVGVQGLEHAIVNFERGINPKKLYEDKLIRGKIIDYKLAHPYEQEMLICEQCDILILAATEKCLKKDVAPNVRAKIVIEATNGPITPSAEQILLGKGVLILPDILVTIGSVLNSHMELLHDLETYILGKYNFHYRGDHYMHFLQSVQDSLNRQQNLNVGELHIIPTSELMRRVTEVKEESMIRATLEGFAQTCTERVLATAEEFDLGRDLRTASYIDAIKKIFENINEAIFTW